MLLFLLFTSMMISEDSNMLYKPVAHPRDWLACYIWRDYDSASLRMVHDTQDYCLLPGIFIFLHLQRVVRTTVC